MIRALGRWLAMYGKGTFRAWDFYAGAALGVLAGAVSLARVVRDAAVPVLLAEAAIGVALTAVVFAAVTIFSTFFDASYRRVLDLAGGFRSALMPYVTVGVVSAVCGATGVLAALALPELGQWPAAIVCGISTWLFGWAIAGTISITELTLFHAAQRAQLMSGADEAETIRAGRLSKHRTP